MLWESKEVPSIYFKIKIATLIKLSFICTCRSPHWLWILRAKHNISALSPLCSELHYFRRDWNVHIFSNTQFSSTALPPVSQCAFVPASSVSAQPNCWGKKWKLQENTENPRRGRGNKGLRKFYTQNFSFYALGRWSWNMMAMFEQPLVTEMKYSSR